MIEKKDLLRPDEELRRIAVLVRDPRKERNRIALKSAKVAERDDAARAGRGGHGGKAMVTVGEQASCLLPPGVLARRGFLSIAAIREKSRAGSLNSHQPRTNTPV